MTARVTQRTPNSGLQAERTALSWTRTSFAVFANGALLLLKHLDGHKGWSGFFPASLAAMIALTTYLIGVKRRETLGRRPVPKHITPRREVHALGIMVVALIAVVAFGLFT